MAGAKVSALAAAAKGAVSASVSGDGGSASAKAAGHDAAAAAASADAAAGAPAPSSLTPPWLAPSVDCALSQILAGPSFALLVSVSVHKGR